MIRPVIAPALAAASVGAAAIGVAQTASADPYDDLWKMVPPGYSEGSCRQAELGVALDPGAAAYVECRQNTKPGGPETARYVLFGDVSSLNRRFAETYNQSPHHFKAKPCPQMPGFPIRWYTRDGTEAGTVACGITEGDYAVVLWTTDSGPMLAWAEGHDLATLSKWWSTVVETA